jgi:transcriptional regulator with XRE-family HTH domain
MEYILYEREHRIYMRWLVIDMKDKGQTENNDISKEFKKKIGAMIKNKRMEFNWTQADLAGKLGMDNVETVRRWEGGTSSPRPEYRRKLIKLLKLRADTFLPAVEHVRPNDVEDEAVIPPPILRKYRGWRTGEYPPFMPGEWPRYDYHEPNQGAGKTYVTVNGYPLEFFHVQYPPYSYRLDWGHIGPPADNLAASLLADYFGEMSIHGKKSEPEKYQTVRHYFQFSTEVVLYLRYEEWELSSDQITDWLRRQKARKSRGE